MITLEQYLAERYLSLSEPSPKRQVSEEIWSLLELTYAEIGGLVGADKENLITTPGMWKLVKKDDKIVAGIIYKDAHGSRKIRLVLHDGTPQGKAWVKKIVSEDIRLNRSWGEVSGALEKVMLKLGAKPIKAERAASILGSPILRIHPDSYHYDREVAPGLVKTQILLGSI